MKVVKNWKCFHIMYKKPKLPVNTILWPQKYDVNWRNIKRPVCVVVHLPSPSPFLRLLRRLPWSIKTIHTKQNKLSWPFTYKFLIHHVSLLHLTVCFAFYMSFSLKNAYMANFLLPFLKKLPAESNMIVMWVPYSITKETIMRLNAQL